MSQFPKKISSLSGIEAFKVINRKLVHTIIRLDVKIENERNIYYGKVQDVELKQTKSFGTIKTIKIIDANTSSTLCLPLIQSFDISITRFRNISHMIAHKKDPQYTNPYL